MIVKNHRPKIVQVVGTKYTAHQILTNGGYDALAPFQIYLSMQKMCKYGVGKIGIVAKKYIIFYVITWQKNSNEWKRASLLLIF